MGEAKLITEGGLQVGIPALEGSSKTRQQQPYERVNLCKLLFANEKLNINTRLLACYAKDTPHISAMASQECLYERK